jgi:hypothetical protein
MIQAVHPGSRFFLSIPDPESRGQKGTGSGIRIRNSAEPDKFQMLDSISRKSKLLKESHIHSPLFGNDFSKM